MLHILKSARSRSRARRIFGPRAVEQHTHIGGCGPSDPALLHLELVVASALRQTLPDFLLNTALEASIATFIVERQDHDTMEMFNVGP
jgi:hypothetical protein